MPWGSGLSKVLPVAADAAATAAQAAAIGASAGATGGAVALGQTAAAAATDAAQLANIAFMTHNTINGIMLEQFSSTMETLRKTNHLGMKTLEKSVPEPPQ